MLDNLTVNTLRTSAVIVATATILGALFTFFRWIESHKKQDDEIKSIKEENKIICLALSACLDGLSQLGANHIVTTAKEDLDKYLLEQAHK